MTTYADFTIDDDGDLRLATPSQVLYVEAARLAELRDLSTPSS